MSIGFILICLVIIFATLSIVTGAMLVMRSFFGVRMQLNRSMNIDLEIIRVAQNKQNETEQINNPEAWKEEIGAMEQLLTTIAHIREHKSFWKTLIYGNPQIILEIAKPADSEEIFFYMAVPKKFRANIEKQVTSYFPEASIDKADDYTIFSPGSATAMSILTLKDTHALPIKTYEMMEVDPLNEISNALSNLKSAQEGACMQIILTKAQSGWSSKGRTIAHKMQQGKRLKDVYTPSVVGKVGKAFSDVVSTTSSSKKNDTSYKENNIVQLTPEEQELVKAIELKTTKTAFSVNIRLIASAASQERAENILGHLENAFSQFEYRNVNHFQVRKRTQKKSIAYRYIFRLYNKKNAPVLNTEEIASIFHFPISTTETPKIKWLKSGAAPPPINVPQEGIVLGYNEYRGVKTDIRLTDGDRRRHLYTIGQTGAGKSTFLQELAKQDIKNGKGICFIDPHGDAIEDILTAVPKERAEDVVYFDPSDTERPFGLNMLEFDRPEEKTFVVNEMINIFDKLYDLKATGGPMFEQYMRNAMLLIMEDPESGSTLMEIPKVLADDDFRQMKLSKCKNPVIKDFWENEAEKAGGEAALANMVPYITSKLTSFLSNDMMRPIISQQKSTLDFRAAMDEGKIVFVNLSKGRIGELNSYLLGMVIVGKILMSALSRVDIAEDDRRDFYLYIDEFQNVTTDSIAQILSEARKYHLNLIIAHQFIGQLSEEISKAVFGNVGSIASFRVGPEDAEFLEKQFEPVFTSNDLVNVDNYQCFMRLLMNNETVKPFSMKTLPPTEGSTEISKHLKELSRLKYGRDAQIVAQEIMTRTGLGR